MYLLLLLLLMMIITICVSIIIFKNKNDKISNKLTDDVSVIDINNDNEII